MGVPRHACASERAIRELRERRHTRPVSRLVSGRRASPGRSGPRARRSQPASCLSAVARKGFRIISGGQTGADRAALDWAIARGIPYAGWCPRGRRAEDGRIPARYDLIQTPSHDYEQRTRWNVRDSDGTLIISRAAKLTGGSAYTARYA